MSGIYIPNMQMPETCYKCRFSVYNTHDPSSSRCAAKDCDIFKDGGNGINGFHRPPYCPLVEVKPHGRLGDLDELERKVIEEADFPSYEWSRAVDQIRNAPTVLEASK